MEQFDRIVLDGFFKPIFLTKIYEAVEALQKDPIKDMAPDWLEKWLKEYVFDISLG